MKKKRTLHQRGFKSPDNVLSSFQDSLASGSMIKYSRMAIKSSFVFICLPYFLKSFVTHLKNSFANLPPNITMATMADTVKKVSIVFPFFISIHAAKIRIGCPISRYKSNKSSFHTNCHEISDWLTPNYHFSEANWSRIFQELLMNNS